MSVHINTEFAISALIGLVVSILLINVGSGPALFKDDEEEEVNDSTTVASKTAEEHLNSSAASTELSLPVINEEYAKKKLAPMQIILGLSDEQMSTAIKDTNKQISESTDTTQLDGSDNLNSFVDGFVIFAALIFGFYVINVFSHGDFGRMLSAMFPVEIDSLKLKDYLEKFHFVK